MTVPLPSSITPVALADWAEAVLLVEGLDLLSKAEVRRRLAPIVEPEEAELALMLSEFRRRAGLGPEVYPFRADLNVIRRVPDIDPSMYEALLLLSLEEADFRRRKRWNTANLLMDRLARDALTSYLGPGAVGRRFAWPASDGRPKPFEEAIRWLADVLNLELGRGPKNPNKKDGGVDVVAWRPFRDTRSKFMIILAQCTLEMNYGHKANDIVLNQWMSWIVFGREPSVALVVPFVIGIHDAVWDDLHFSSTVVLDRTRLTELLADISPSDEDMQLLRRWASHEREALGVD